jgi:hypothetical protein
MIYMVLYHSNQADQTIDQPWAYERTELAALYEFFNTNTACQVPRNSIPKNTSRLIALAEVLTHFPELVTARFIKPRRGKEVSLYNGLNRLRSIHRLAQRLEVPHIARRIRRCRDPKDLLLLLRKLQLRASDRIVNNLALVDLDNLDAVIDCVGSWLGDVDRQQLQRHWFDDYGLRRYRATPTSLPCALIRHCFWKLISNTTARPAIITIYRITSMPFFASWHRNGRHWG